MGGREWREENAHAEKLLPEVDSLLRSLGRPKRDIGGLAIAVGPGSFTGIRIGIATFEGLSFSLRRPIVGITSLEATAFRHRRRSGMVVSFIDARRGEVYAQVFRAHRGEIVEAGEPLCDKPERLLAKLPAEPLLLTGSGVRTYAALARGVRGAGPWVLEEGEAGEGGFTTLAVEVARLGHPRLERGEGTALGGLEPSYLRPSDAERAASSP